MMSNQAENRSHHEKEEYTGVVNLSGRHLKRIECLPKGISPCTLLLSNNEISKVENLQYFAHLQQLSLAGNHIVDIKGISAASSLRVLDLSNNSIIAIEGVSSLRSLEWLNLSGNSIEQIENLDRNYNLYHLDLSDNCIAVLSGLQTLKKLKTLLLHGNLISSLAVIKDQIPNTVCTVSLADNEISDLNEVTYLSSLINLEQLSLVNNPCVLSIGTWRQEVNYRPYLVYCCGNLRNLDGQLVNNQERMLARLLDQAFNRIGHPSLGQHVQLVSILLHICADPTPVTQTMQADTGDDLDDNKLLESESFYIPVPSSDLEQTESDDPIMTEEEAIRLLSLAATIIQAHVRGYLVRKKFDFCQYRRRNYAAACIQAVWKGYRARTRDIKVVNIRNELRVRRLISLIHNLYSTLEREHENAVKSREQLTTAIKYLWYQVTEQKRLNQIQLHKEQVKAAIKIQACWRGWICRKAFPRKSVNRDKVAMLLSLCRKLQMQLDVVTSQINEITKGAKQSKESQPADQTDSEGQDQFYEMFSQLDSSQDTISPLPDGEGNHIETRPRATAVQRVDAKLGASITRSLDDAQANKAGDLKTPENNITEPGQRETEEELVGSNASVPLHPKLGTMVPSLAGQTDQEASEMALSGTHTKMDLCLSKVTSSNDLEEDNLVTSALTEEEDEPSACIGHTVHEDNDEEQSLDGHTDLKPRSETEAHEQEPRSETEPRADDVQMDKLEEDTASCAGLPASVAVSQGSEPTDEAPNEAASGEETLLVSIPEIIVSSPVPTDDEGSDAGSAVEGDTNDMQGDVEDSRKDRQDDADDQSHSHFSWKSPSSYQEKESQPSEADSFTDGTKDNTSSKQKSGIFEKLHESNLLPFRSTKDFSVSKEASTEKPGKEAIADQSNLTGSQESAPNLGERASSLLSQLRSEIASMKTARLSSASPIIAPDSDADAPEISPGRDASQPTSQEGDTAQPGPVSAVTYRLPLFEDLDSACTSFSLDDLLSDPVIEEDANSASETHNIHEGAES